MRYANAPTAMLTRSPVRGSVAVARRLPPRATAVALPIWRVVLNSAEAVPA